MNRERTGPEEEMLAPAAGSELYYTLLYEPEPRARASQALHALHALVIDTPTRCSDPGLARIRLAWVREELARFAAGESRHPITRALPPALAAAEPLAELEACVTAVDREVDRGAPPADEEWHDWCAQTAGRIWRCWARVLGARTAEAPQVMAELGACIGQWRVLEWLRRDLDAGYQRIPDSLLARARREAAGAGNPVFLALTAELEDQLGRALAALPAADRRRLLPARIHARLKLATVRESRASGAHLLDRRVELTPVRRLLLAWRERWRR